MDEPEKHPGERFLTPVEVTEWLSITPRQLRNLREKRQIPFTRVGGQARFKKEDIQAYLDARTVTAK